MNTCLLLHRLDHDFRPLIQSLADHNPGKVNAALVVMHTTEWSDAKVRELIAPLVGKFAYAVAMKVSAGRLIKVRSAPLLATFLMKHYAKHPGPWLVIDEPCILKAPLTTVAGLHRAGNKGCSGRGATDGAAFLPVGPVVLGCPANKLKILFTTTGEDWRVRAQWLFRTDFHKIPLDQYPFELTPVVSTQEAGAVPAPRQTMTKAEVMEDVKASTTLPPEVRDFLVAEYSKEAQPPVIEGNAELVPAEPESYEPAVNDITTREAVAEIEEAQSAQPEVVAVEPATEARGKQPDPASFTYTDDEQAAIEAKDYAKLGQAAAFKLLWQRSGKRPHHFTKLPGLLEQIAALDLEVADV